MYKVTVNGKEMLPFYPNDQLHQAVDRAWSFIHNGKKAEEIDILFFNSSSPNKSFSVLDNPFNLKLIVNNRRKSDRRKGETLYFPNDRRTGKDRRK